VSDPQKDNSATTTRPWWHPTTEDAKVLGGWAGGVGAVAAIFQFIQTRTGGGIATLVISTGVVALFIVLFMAVRRRRKAVLGGAIVLVVLVIGAGLGYLAGTVRSAKGEPRPNPSAATVTPPEQGSTSVPLKAAAFDPSRPGLYAAVSVEGTLAEWKLEQPRSEFRAGATGAAGTIRALALDKTTPNTLAVGRGDGSLEIWDSTHLTGSSPRTAAGQEAITALAFDPTSKNTLAVGRESGALEVWDSSKPARTANVADAGDAEITALALDPTTPNTLVCADADGTVEVWDRTKLDQPVDQSKINGHDRITALALDPRVKNSLAIGFSDGTVEIRDRTKLGSPLRASTGDPKSPVLALSFDQDLLTAIRADHSAVAWDSTVLAAPVRTYGG